MTQPTRRWDRHGSDGPTFIGPGPGTAPLGNPYRAISDQTADTAFDAAWNAGARYLGTAPRYGLGLRTTGSLLSTGSGARP